MAASKSASLCIREFSELRNRDLTSVVRMIQGRHGLIEKINYLKLDGKERTMLVFRFGKEIGRLRIIAENREDDPNFLYMLKII